MPKLRTALKAFLWALLLIAFASFALFAFNGLVIPVWYQYIAHESAYQTQHGGYFVGALVMMVLSALLAWLCWRGIKKLS